MKKLFFFLALATMVVACSNPKVETTSTDSTTLSVDTPSINELFIDTTAVVELDSVK